MRGASFIVITLLMVLFALAYAKPQDPAGYCAKAVNLCNVTEDSFKGDWLVLYSSSIKRRNGASYWGGDFPYDFCDPLNLNSGCMAVGYSILPTSNSSKQVGYAYSLNAFTNTWTIEQLDNFAYQVPGTNFFGFRTSYNHFVQVEESVIFVNGTPQACGSKIVRSGPIYRAANYVLLAAAPDFSWAILLYCDTFYGFVDDSAPVIQVIVKKEIIDKCSYPFNTLYFYNDLKKALLDNHMNVYASDFELIYHDVGGVYPTSVSWSSIQWEADCVCTSSSS